MSFNVSLVCLPFVHFCRLSFLYILKLCKIVVVFFCGNDFSWSHSSLCRSCIVFDFKTVINDSFWFLKCFDHLFYILLILNDSQIQKKSLVSLFRQKKSALFILLYITLLEKETRRNLFQKHRISPLVKAYQMNTTFLIEKMCIMKISVYVLTRTCPLRV